MSFRPHKGAIPVGLIFAIDQQGMGAQATRFEPPAGSRLDRVTLALHFYATFGGSSAY